MDSGAAQTTLKNYLERLARLAASKGSHWNLDPVIPERLSFAQSAEDGPLVVLHGPPESFGHRLRGTGSFWIDGTDASTGKPVCGLAFPSRRRDGMDVACATDVFELILRGTPTLSNRELLREYGWALNVLRRPPGPLSRQAQKGLVGELLCFIRLANVARREGIPIRNAFERWKGHMAARHDFASKHEVVESKATSRRERFHYFSDEKQLDVVNGRKLYVWSVSLHFDASSPRKLCDLVDEAEKFFTEPDGRTDEEILRRFRAALRARGYNEQDRPSYQAGHGIQITLAPLLYKVPPAPDGPNDDAARMRGIRKRAAWWSPPAPALTREDQDAVFLGMLRDQPTSPLASLRDLRTAEESSG